MINSFTPNDAVENATFVTTNLICLLKQFYLKIFFDNPVLIIYLF